MIPIRASGRGRRHDVPISRCLHHRGSGNPQRSVNSRRGAPARCHGLPRRKGQRCSVISRRAGAGVPARHIASAGYIACEAHIAPAGQIASQCAQRNSRRAAPIHAGLPAIHAARGNSFVPLVSFTPRSRGISRPWTYRVLGHIACEAHLAPEGHIPFLASRTERQSLPRFCKLPLKKWRRIRRNGRKRRLFIFALFSFFRRFAQLFSLVLVCSADFVRKRPILPCFFVRDVV